MLLGTALVHIRDGSGALQTVRAIVNLVSQISAITTACSSRLGLQRSKWMGPVTGLVGATVHGVQGLVDCQVQPRYATEPIFELKAWVFPTITADMPRQPVALDVAERYRHVALADPTFTIPKPVDLLLGADIFSQILDGKRFSVGEQYPVAFGTAFGFIVIGSVPQSIPVSNIGTVSLTTSVEMLMNKFWQIEEPEQAPEEFTNNGKCELMFRNGHVRDEAGRYSVPFLFRQPTAQVNFPGSKAVATKIFGHLEKKLMSDQHLRSFYCQFMAEYQSDGHMTPASSAGSYFIPHHAIYRPSDTSPKIRVVFDASAKDYSGTSLNDVLLLFRLSRYAFTCNISKMYRQIRISPEHRKFQHVLWRASPQDELQAFELNTVTYGVNCSPFLAIRVLQQIADTECNNFPLVREALLFHTYVDDICVGADSEAAAIQLQSDLINILRRSGMELKKWTNNTE